MTKAFRDSRLAFIYKLKAERGCARCGEKNPVVLDFHHRDRSTKHFVKSQQWVTVSLETLMVEVEKCDVLCANCHRIIEHELRSDQGRLQ